MARHLKAAHATDLNDRRHDTHRRDHCELLTVGDIDALGLHEAARGFSGELVVGEDLMRVPIAVPLTPALHPPLPRRTPPCPPPLSRR